MQRRDFIKSLMLGLAAFVPWGKAPAPVVIIPAGTYVISQELIDDDIAWSAVWRRVAGTDAWNQFGAVDSWADDSGERESE